MLFDDQINDLRTIADMMEEALATAGSESQLRKLCQVLRNSCLRKAEALEHITLRPVSED